MSEFRTQPPAIEWHTVGEVLSEHQIPNRQTVLIVCLGLFLFAAGGAVVAYMWWHRMIFDPGISVKLKLLPAALGLVGAVFTIAALYRSRLRLVVCDKGLVREWWRKVELIRWEEVREVRRTVVSSGIAEVSGVAPLVILGPTDKGWNVYRDLTDYKALERHIFALTFPILYEATRLAVEAGVEVQYGPIRVSAAGVHCKKKLWPWSQVARVQHGEDEYIRIWGHDPKKPVWQGKANPLPNPHVLDAIVLSLQQRAAEGEV